MSMKHPATVPPILNMIKICEIYRSIQGESTRAGMVCTFVRLSGCNLSCSYCDTPYALQEGTKYTIDEIVEKVEEIGCSLVEITGGEPLLQEETPLLCRKLLSLGHTVLVETNGTFAISLLPQDCAVIMDIKCPGSGSTDSFCLDNIPNLRKYDDVKMVISGRDDFDWALKFLHKHSLHKKCTVIFSPNTKKVSPKELAKWILDANAPVRLGLQLHKIIWGEDTRGV